MTEPRNKSKEKRRIKVTCFLFLVCAPRSVCVIVKTLVTSKSILGHGLVRFISVVFIWTIRQPLHLISGMNSSDMPAGKIRRFWLLLVIGESLQLTNSFLLDLICGAGGGGSNVPAAILKLNQHLGPCAIS
jgi:hypothetical protein